MSAESNGQKKPAVWRRIGRRVRKLRRENKLTLDELAGRIDTQKGALSLMERGERDFGAERMTKLARELRTTVASLYGEKPPEGSHAG